MVVTYVMRIQNSLYFNRNHRPPSRNVLTLAFKADVLAQKRSFSCVIKTNKYDLLVVDVVEDMGKRCESWGGKTERREDGGKPGLRLRWVNGNTLQGGCDDGVR